MFKSVSETANFDKEAMLVEAGKRFANGEVKLKFGCRSINLLTMILLYNDIAL